MSDLEISSSTGIYEITFADFWPVEDLSIYYLVDSFFEESIEWDQNRVIFVEANENSKTLSSIEKILIELAEVGMKKKSTLVVVGGGCIQDIGTLVASLYMRGISWTYVPTTLAAMGDSCVGGKSSINAGKMKNLIGNFYPPKEVLIDTKFCKSLPTIEVIAGISEIIKICYARSSVDFRAAIEIASDPDLRNRSNQIEALVRLSLGCKKYFVEEDEFDIGIRKLLNFGHSFGHALESASNYEIQHGVAVMVGMIAAINHPESDQSKESRALYSLCIDFLKKVKNEIKRPLENFDLKEFSSRLTNDKKNTQSELVLILPKESGLSIRLLKFEEGAITIAANAMDQARKRILREIF